MNNSALKDIQQSLNIIRTEIVKVDAETKMAALELIMSTSQSVVAMARKLTKPKVRTKIKKVVIPKTKIIDATGGERPIKITRSKDNQYNLQGLTSDEILEKIDPNTFIFGISLMFSQEWIVHRSLIEKIKKNIQRLLLLQEENIHQQYRNIF